MTRFTEKLRSKSDSASRKNTKARPLILSVMAMALCAALIIGSYAWYNVFKDRTNIIIDSEGIKIDASLYFVNGAELNEDPPDTDYILLQRTVTNTIDDGFFVGGRLYYKMTVTNKSDEHPHTSDKDYVGGPLDIGLSFAYLSDYLNEAEALYNVNPSDENIMSVIKSNNGIILFKISHISYKVDNGDGNSARALTGYTVPANNLLAVNYANNESFFEYPSLGVGQTLTVYFALECTAPFEATTIYETYRRGVIDAEADATRKAVLTELLKTELSSIVIEKDSSSAASARLNIEAISVLARQGAE